MCCRRGTRGWGRQRILSENAQTGTSTWPMKTLAILAVFAAIVMARSFLMPVFLAFLLSLTFSPVRRFLQRRGVPPYLTAGLLEAEREARGLEVVAVEEGVGEVLLLPEARLLLRDRGGLVCRRGQPRHGDGSGELRARLRLR